MQVNNSNKTIIKIKKQQMKPRKPIVNLLANISVNLFAFSAPLMFLFGGVEYIAASQENYESAYALNKMHLACKGASMISVGLFVTALLIHLPEVSKED